MLKYLSNIRFFTLLLASNFCLMGGVYAQSDEVPNPPADAVAETGAQENTIDTIQDNTEAIETRTNDPEIMTMMQRILDKGVSINLVQIPSLFFTIYEQNLIADARKGFVARPPTETEIAESIEAVKEEKERIRGPREISIGGIIYASSGDWSIWLNGQKVTPDRLPSEILDIRVQKDHVKLKWFDSYTNQIFPIKLRTHQRFNIDTRIFLPG